MSPLMQLAVYCASMVGASYLFGYAVGLLTGLVCPKFSGDEGETDAPESVEEVPPDGPPGRAQAGGHKSREENDRWN